MVKPSKCQLITSLDTSISFSGIGTMERLGCRAKMSEVGESTRLNTGKRNPLSVQFLYKTSLKFKIKSNTLRHTQNSKAIRSVFSRLLLLLFCIKIYFKVWAVFYYIPIIKRVGKGQIPFEFKRGISSKNHSKSTYFMIDSVWDNAHKVI